MLKVIPEKPIEAKCGCGQVIRMYRYSVPYCPKCKKNPFNRISY